MTKQEFYMDQIEEARSRKDEPKIKYITPKQCMYRVNGGHGPGIACKKAIATIVGAYFYDYWHPYMYKAYHIINEDGTKDTIPAQWVVKTW